MVSRSWELDMVNAPFVAISWVASSNFWYLGPKMTGRLKAMGSRVLWMPFPKPPPM